MKESIKAETNGMRKQADLTPQVKEKLQKKDEPDMVNIEVLAACIRLITKEII